MNGKVLGRTSNHRLIDLMVCNWYVWIAFVKLAAVDNHHLSVILKHLGNVNLNDLNAANHVHGNERIVQQVETPECLACHLPERWSAEEKII